MEENEDIKEAKEELDKISRDDILRRMALKAEIERMDRHEFEMEARERGLEEGKKRGIEEGIRKDKSNIVINMYKKKYSILEIAQIVELEEQEVEKIISKEYNK